MDSILNSVKKIVDIDPSNTAFDDQLIIHINTALNVLRQLGVGDDEYPLIIVDKDDKWEDLDGENRTNCWYGGQGEFVYSFSLYSDLTHILGSQSLVYAYSFQMKKLLFYIQGPTR